jgi:hypothetical protein
VGLVLLVLCTAGAALFLDVVGDHYPVKKWLFWIYAEVWLFTLVFGAACLSAGDLVLTRLFRFTAPLRQRMVMSFAVGVYLFAAGVFVAGLFRALRPPFFFAWPFSLIAVGAWPLLSTWRRVFRSLPHARMVAARPSWLGGLALLFGLGGAALLYMNILTPANVAFDSRWYHLAIAEHYAAERAVARFPEGWFCGTYPHLASFLYTWAFILPRADLFSRIELAAHLEFLVFVATLAGVAVLARRCAAGTRIRHGWAAVFLFPGILLYDSTLSVAADHVLAFWAPPIALATWRLWRRWDRSSAVLLGLVVAGAILTKYQAIYLVAASLLGVGARAVRALVTAARARGGTGAGVLGRTARAAAPLGALVGAVLVLTTPLWLKNWIWYHDPVYPMLPRLFGADPWVPGTDPEKFLRLAMWTPQGALPDRVRETLLATFTFAFKPHNWSNLHGSWPVFGSLFTLCLPLLGLVATRRRTVWLALGTLLGIAIWYWTYHQDRYLQALLPWMAAVVAAVLAGAWRAGWLARAGVTLLVVAQVVWGGDIWAIPTHAMIGQPPAKLVLDLFGAAFRGDFAGRLNSHQDMAPVAKVLPRRSKVVIHERLVHLGVGVPSVADAPGTQGAISYTRLGSPRGVNELLRKLGVTHLLWSPGVSHGWHTVADDLVFFESAENYTLNRTTVAGMTLAELPTLPPAPVAEPRVVRVHQCGRATRSVALGDLDAALANQPVPEVAAPTPPAFVVVEGACAAFSAEDRVTFRSAARRTGYELWIRAIP